MKARGGVITLAVFTTIKYNADEALLYIHEYHIYFQVANGYLALHVRTIAK
jgi:hypothetical protein